MKGANLRTNLVESCLGFRSFEIAGVTSDRGFKTPCRHRCVAKNRRKCAMHVVGFIEFRIEADCLAHLTKGIFGILTSAVNDTGEVMCPRGLLWLVRSREFRSFVEIF